MTDEILKECIFSVALAEHLLTIESHEDKYAQLFIHHLNGLNLNTPKARIFYQFTAEYVRTTQHIRMRYIGMHYGKPLANKFCDIVDIEHEPQLLKKDDDIDYYHESDTICINGKYHHPWKMLDCNLNDIVEEIKKLKNYSMGEKLIEKELEEMKKKVRSTKSKELAKKLISEFMLVKVEPPINESDLFDCYTFPNFTQNENIDGHLLVYEKTFDTWVIARNIITDKYNHSYFEMMTPLLNVKDVENHIRYLQHKYGLDRQILKKEYMKNRLSKINEDF